MNVGYACIEPLGAPAAEQLEALSAAGCHRVFQDLQPTAGCDRPQRAACLEALRPGDALIVCELAVLARTLREVVALVHGLLERGVGLRCLDGSIDTAGDSACAVAQAFEALARFERRHLEGRSRVGLAAARARGRKGGRKPALSSAEVSTAAAMLCDPGVTKAQVARHFKVSRVTLNASLARAGLTG